MDEIGGLNTAIEYAAKQAKLGNNWEVEEYPQVTSWEERFFGKAAEETRTALGIKPTEIKPVNPLTAEFQKLQQQIAILQTMNDPQGVYARLPFNLKID